MKIDEAAGFLKSAREDTGNSALINVGSYPWKTQYLIEAGNLVIEAMEIICYADRELSDYQFSKMRIERETQIETQIKAAMREENDIQRKEMLSAAGRLGAQAKNLDSKKFKDWALAKAIEMRGADIDIARMLSANLPIHFADVSKNPERFIYDALRMSKKVN